MTTFAFDVFPVLHTERLTLRRIMAADADDWLAVLKDEQVRKYLVDIEEMTDLKNLSPIIDWTESIFRAGSGMRWAITLKQEDRLIGTCGYHVYRPQHQRAEIGYELASAHWRKGIMTEALHTIFAFGFDKLALHRIEADVTEGNEASAGLLRSLGFVQEGTWRDRVYALGRYWSLWQFGLLRDDYQAPNISHFRTHP